MIDGKKNYDQPVKNDLRTYDNIGKIVIGQGDDYATGSLLYCPYLNENYQLVALDLNKQKALDANLKSSTRN